MAASDRPPPAPLALAQQGTSLSLQVRSVDDLQRLARLFAASGLFGRSANPDATLAQCAVQLLAGMEAGMTPFASITSVYVVSGRPGFSAQALAQAIKRHPDYDYRVLEKTDQVCRIRFLCRGEELGIETFTIDMARRANLVGKAGPWTQYPEAMLFARCLSAGMRTHCPDALGGHTPYTPEELGARGTIDDQGMVTAVDVQVQPAQPTHAELVQQATAAVTACGLTGLGLSVFLDEIGPVSTLAELSAPTLQRMVNVGVSAETVARCNAAAEALVSPVDDEPPARWQEPASAVAA